MSRPAITYLSNDAITEGVGASQVLAYVERLPSRGIDVTLHSFEKEPVTAELRARLEQAGVRWHPHPWGRYGSRGGIERLLEGRRAVCGADIVHTRADLAAASGLLARARRLVWDCRGLYADQRIALGMLRERSAEIRVLRAIERQAARRSAAIITLTDAVIPVLEERHGPGIAAKTTVITTCVDTTRFVPAPLADDGPVRFLLAGTLNAYYDIPIMVRLVDAVQRRTATEVVVATPSGTPPDPRTSSLDATRIHARPAEMAGIVAAAHVGLTVCRDDAGVSLTGSMPTKIAEFLASGRPVAVNALLGDASSLVRQHRCGVVVGGSSQDYIDAAADELLALLADPDLSRRCRALAEEHFDLDRAVDRLARLYERLAASAG